MSTIADQFFAQSPNKILEKAEIYSKTLHDFHELPQATNKSMIVCKKAQQYKNQIVYAIHQSQYQQHLFRQKQEEDLTARSKYYTKIKQSLDRNAANGQQIEKKKVKEAQRYAKHLKQVFSKFDEQQKKHRQNEKQESSKLKKELLEFYDKQQKRKEKAEYNQIQVGTCYQAAVDRINQIHKKNQEYAQLAQQELHQQLIKNNHFDQIISARRRSLSSCNKRKSKAFRNSIDISNSLEHHFIQKYGSKEDGSIKAWKCIQNQCGKTKKRIGEFFKKRYEKWSSGKKRVDEANEQVADRCTSILQKTERASFRQTASSFRTTAKEWTSSVSQNKAAIKQHDELQKDKIMDLHLDLRLMNTATSKMTDRMKVMRLQAKKLADAFV